ncbi:ComEA family DNA-binding protein [Nocardia sp. GCM10030253]|uniref:ComEA family DNA-binding protein n=1 Tax=Nocardia sp. GCM10030253 TaxID=3273404 RepID=UPI00363C59A3
MGQIGRAGVMGGGRWDDDRLSSKGMESDERDGESGGDRDPAGGVGEVRVPGWLEEASSGSLWRDRLVPERFRGARFDPGWRGVVTLALVGLAAVVLATVVVLRERPVAQPVPPLPAVRTTTTAPAAAHLSSSAEVPSAGAPPGAAPAPPDGPDGVTTVELVVSVIGLVHNGGLLRMPNGSRVADAIAAAGGAKVGADLSGLNLAQRLQDGDQVLVGATGPNPGPPHLGSTTVSAAGGAAAASAPRSNSAPPPPAPTGRIDLNTATESDLDALPGVGPVTARAIITWRTKNGRFTDIEQLGEVDGIGPTRLGRLRGLVRV